jgi:Tol biopolymer transport system component
VNEAAELVALDTSAQDPKPRVLLSGLPEGARPNDDLDPSLSIASDGRSMLMVRGTTGANLARLDLSRPTEAVHRITSGTGSFLQPRISPDGHWIAATAGAGGRRIIKIPLLGGNPIALTSGGSYHDHSPAWSSDGTRIAFTSDRGGTPAVWVMNADGQHQKQLSLGPVGPNLRVTWTPDDRIAWQQVTADNYLTYRIKNLTNGEETLLANTTHGYLRDPRFSPKGDRVAVFWQRSQPGLWLLTWPGRVETFLHSNWYYPMGWSADGHSIYAYEAGSATTRGAVLAVAAETGESRLVASMPDGVVIDDGDSSPDGKYLVLSLLEIKADAWVVTNFDPRIGG